MAGKKWTTEEDRIMELNYKTMAVSDISLMLPNRSIMAITNRARVSGLARAYIDYKLSMSPNDAYYLGWIASDGNLWHGETGYSIRLVINTIDAKVLNQLKDHLCIGYIARTVKSITFKDGTPGISDLTSFKIHNKSLFNQMCDFGITPNKSKTIEWIVIDDHLYKDFIRGVFDGDGSIFWKRGYVKRPKNSNWMTDIASASLPFLEGLHNYLKNNGIVSKGWIKKQKNCYHLGFSVNDTKSLGRWLYYDGCLKLDRKYDKFQKAINGISGEKDVI